MLPGFRFLFATVVLAASVLVFGLGAAALLRAAHEEFANLPSWRLAQPPTLAPPADTRPMLAMLRVDTLPAAPVAALRAPAPAVTEDRPQSVAARTDEPDTATDTAQAPVTDQPPPTTSDTLYEQASTDPSPSETPGRSPPEAQSAPETPGAPETTSSLGGAPEGNSSDPNTFDPKAGNGAATESAPDTKASEASTIRSVAPQIHSTAATAAVTVPGKPAVRKARRPSAQAIARRREIARARAAARAQQQQTQTFSPFGS